MCDVEDPVNALAEVAQGAVDQGVTLIVAFSEAECGRYLELLKVYENKQADALRPQTDTDYVVRCAPHPVCTGANVTGSGEDAASAWALWLNCAFVQGC